MSSSYQDFVQAYLDAMDPPARVVGYPDAPAAHVSDTHDMAITADTAGVYRVTVNGIDVTEQFIRAHTAPPTLVWELVQRAVAMVNEPSRKKHIYVPKSDVQDAMKQVVEKHLGGPLPEDTKVTNNWTTPDKWCIEIDSQEFPQNPDDKTSQELKPRKR
jgi:hypothetical protein